MSHKFLFNSSFHAFLIKIDSELAENIRQQGCQCGGSLHHSNYPRSPIGIQPSLRESYSNRFSFCCDRCRKRITPPSVRFFGRRWYPAPLLILISALMVSITEYRLRQIKRHFGITISESTWKRWRRWWRTHFVTTPFWRGAKGSFLELTESTKIVRQLLKTFQGKLEANISSLLHFLSPITTGDLRAV